MIIEVTGTSTENKGAELMLLAIKQHYAKVAPNVRLAVEPWFGSFEERASHGLLTKTSFRRFGRSALATAIMPKSCRRLFGLVREDEFEVVLDASGFAFSDQLEAERTEHFAKSICRWKKQGKTIVLLPQALGPFRTPRVQSAFRHVVENADLIFARDRISFGNLEELGGDVGKIRLSSDFTPLVKGTVPCGFDPPPRMALIVPNHRMIEKTDATERKRYLPLLETCIYELISRDMQPVLLLHDNHQDRVLVEPLQQMLRERIPVIQESDPTHLKGILGSAHVVVGSRFHALVSALSQGVPCLATGWSHKYEMLFEDYGCGSFVLSMESSPEYVEEKLSQLLEEPERSEIVASIREASASNILRIRKMWSEVDELLGFQTSRPLSSTDDTNSSEEVTAHVC